LSQQEIVAVPTAAGATFEIVTLAVALAVTTVALKSEKVSSFMTALFRTSSGILFPPKKPFHFFPKFFEFHHAAFTIANHTCPLQTQLVISSATTTAPVKAVSIAVLSLTK
jgi:hypothetical protein